MKIQTTLKTSEDLKYTQNEWRDQTTLGTSEEFKLIEPSEELILLETSGDSNYTRNEWRSKLHPKRVKIQTTLETSENDSPSQNQYKNNQSQTKHHIWYEIKIFQKYPHQPVFFPEWRELSG